MGKILLNIILDPPKWLIIWLKAGFNQFTKMPCRYLSFAMVCTIFIGLSYSYIKWGDLIDPLRFYHQNSHLIRSIDDDKITSEMRLGLVSMGMGTTVAEISIGYSNLSDEKKTMAFDKVFSCIPTRGDKENCLVNSKLLNPNWYKPAFLEKEDSESLEKMTIPLYNSKLTKVNMGFSENSPVCVDVFDSTNKLTVQFATLRDSFPKFSEKILNISANLNEGAKGSYIHEVCFTKINHPIYKNVIYLFLFTFWSYDGVLPEMLNYDMVRTALKSIGDKKKQNLGVWN